ncbi:MAG: C39 family peptidase [Natronospirillum sp.]|uniref:C39 family peptidase n=1 Tax=Natronospirillum sp. TaxID=2812955 RepID=UPI0025FFB2FA|nr:C39 family peptidase [Natronospirillum sp.]MCH8550433.1 C39 family peptidase [Natronospirillum sp.]
MTLKKAFTTWLVPAALLIPTAWPGAATPWPEPSDDWQSAREETVVMQEHDYSCGAATIATVLNYHYGESLREQEVLDHMLDRLDSDARDVVLAEGFTFLDLQGALAWQGYRGVGIQASLEDLIRFNTPAIVQITNQVTEHFVVWRGIENGRVVVADPYVGIRHMPVYRFKEEWTGAAMIVGLDDEPLYQLDSSGSVADLSIQDIATWAMQY